MKSRILLGAALSAALCITAWTSPGAPVSQNPIADLHFNHRSSKVVTGEVKERLLAGSYTYLLIQNETGPAIWAVIMGAGPSLGAPVSLRVVAYKTGFYSRRLNRTFDRLAFGFLAS